MSQALIDKLKKSRESLVFAGGYSFTIRRPTDMEITEFRGQNIKQGDIMRRFVIDWQGVGEVDIVPGGTGVAVPFDSDLFMCWVEDKPDLWAPIVQAITDAYTAHIDKTAAALGEPSAG